MPLVNNDFSELEQILRNLTQGDKLFALLVGIYSLIWFYHKGPRNSSPSTFEPRRAGTVTEALTTTTTTTVPPTTTETKLISKF